MSVLIDIKDIYFSYNPDSKTAPPALDGVTMAVEQGDYIAVLGYNGSGKSTLAKHMNAILVPSEGLVLVCDMNTADDEHLYDIRERVGMVFQNPDNQIVASVVEEDVAFALENLGVEPAEIRRRVDEALDVVGMGKHKTDSPHRLSGGQKQRVAIAGILAMQPSCVVLDEPTAMLDPKGREIVNDTIERLNKQQGITVVLITHYMEEATRADKVVVLSEGKIAKSGTPREVFGDIEGIRALGLDVPQTTELCHLLHQSGVDIAGDIVDSAACVDRLSELLEAADGRRS